MSAGSLPRQTAALPPARAAALYYKNARSVLSIAGDGTCTATHSSTTHGPRPRPHNLSSFCLYCAPLAGSDHRASASCPTAGLKDADECIRLAPDFTKGYSRKGHLQYFMKVCSPVLPVRCVLPSGAHKHWSFGYFAKQRFGAWVTHRGVAGCMRWAGTLPDAFMPLPRRGCTAMAAAALLSTWRAAVRRVRTSSPLFVSGGAPRACQLHMHGCMLHAWPPAGAHRSIALPAAPQAHADIPCSCWSSTGLIAHLSCCRLRSIRAERLEPPQGAPGMLQPAGFTLNARSHHCIPSFFARAPTHHRSTTRPLRPTRRG